MKHLKKGRKFGKKRDQRAAFLAGLMNNLIEKESIITTKIRAKKIKSKIDRVFNKAKGPRPQALRYLLEHNINKRAAFKLIHQLIPTLEKKSSGFTRISHTGLRRKRDGVETARLEIIK